MRVELAIADAAYLESTVTKDEILANVAAGEIPVEEASKLLEKAGPAKKGSLYCKVSEKGALSVYGLQRMPVTLYVEQWQRLLDFADQSSSSDLSFSSRSYSCRRRS